MKKVRLAIIGVLSLLYWFLPVVQDFTFDNYLERTEDYGGVLYFPVMLFQGVNMISPILSYIVQFIGFVLTCLVLHWLAKTINSLITTN